jgi:hypothetical protein
MLGTPGMHRALRKVFPREFPRLRQSEDWPATERGRHGSAVLPAQARVKWTTGAAIMSTTPTVAKTPPMTRIMATWRAMRCSWERESAERHGGIRVSGLSSGSNISSVFLPCHSTQPRKFAASARPPTASTRPTASMRSLGSIWCTTDSPEGENTDDHRALPEITGSRLSGGVNLLQGIVPEGIVCGSMHGLGKRGSGPTSLRWSAFRQVIWPLPPGVLARAQFWAQLPASGMAIARISRRCRAWSRALRTAPNRGQHAEESCSAGAARAASVHRRARCGEEVSGGHSECSTAGTTRF